MRDVVRNLRSPAPYVLDVSETLTEALGKSFHSLAPLLEKDAPANVCICCGARRLSNGEMPCDH